MYNRLKPNITLCEFLSIQKEVGVTISAQDDLSPLTIPLQLSNNKFLSNRCIALPLEGFDSESDGSVSALSLRRYKRFASGGFGGIWVEATAVSELGRGHRGMFRLYNENLESFTQLINYMRVASLESESSQHPYIVIQLHHSGRFGQHPIILFHEPMLDRASNISLNAPVVDDETLFQIEEEYVKTAHLAKFAGADAVDVKCCHGYLLYELFRARTRLGEFGGSYENRTRLVLNIIKRIKQEVGIDCAVRMDVFSGESYPYGWGTDRDGNLCLDEPIQFAKDLVSAGVSMISISNGNPYINPYLSRPFNSKREQPEHPLISIERLITCATNIQKVVGDIPVVGVGFSSLGHLGPSVAAALLANEKLKLVGWGRQAFAYPSFFADIKANGTIHNRQCCTACDGCIKLLESGNPVGCVVHDKLFYSLQQKNNY